MNYSKQREIIINYIKNSKSHPTAEMIYKDLRLNNSTLSLGTVYRNLDMLSKSGDIIRLKQFGNKDRFDDNSNHHYHGECIKCGKIVDIYVDYLEDIDRNIENVTNYDILSHDIKFNIICPKCK